MRIAVIVPYYHGQKYIKHLCDMLRKNAKCLNQEDRMEAVFVNDSPQEMLEIDPEELPIPTKILKNEKNYGIHRSRVVGLQNTTADCVMFLDQDDIIQENCIKSQLEKIGDADFCVCMGEALLEDGTRKPFYKNEKQLKACLNLKVHYAYENIIVSPGQVLLKRTSIPEEWISCTFQRNGADDHYLWLLLLENGSRGAVNPEQLYTHVSTGNNTSMNGAEMCASKLELVERMRDKTTKRNCQMLTRRALYYASDAKKIRTKLRFLDVILRRKWILFTVM